MIKKKYDNAAKVLPKYVLELIQHHYSSGLLWIPAKVTPETCEGRIIDLYRSGCGTAEIAGKVRRTQRRVNQVLKHYKEIMTLYGCKP